MNTKRGLESTRGVDRDGGLQEGTGDYIVMQFAAPCGEKGLVVSRRCEGRGMVGLVLFQRCRHCFGGVVCRP